MNQIMNWLASVNWETLGAIILTTLSFLSTIIIWLRRNLSNIEKLKSESKLTNDSINYSKANIKSNKDLQIEVNQLKKEVINLGKVVNLMTKELLKGDNKDDL